MAGRPRDRWPELCKLVEQDDGLATRGAGPWAEDKLWLWNRYIEITTTAMGDHPSWKEGLVYVDLFAGPGVCVVKESGKRIPGSPLIAAQAPKPFRKILICEKDKTNADACETRLRNVPTPPMFQVFVGDCNRCIEDICQEIPKGALTVAFLDPTGLHAEISTLGKLTKNRKVDLLILFPDAIDAVRNAEKYYLPRNDSKLDRVFGRGSEWREKWNELPTRDGPVIRRWFASLYQAQLRECLGYTYFAEKVITGPHGPLYRLVYASRDAMGLSFWDKVSLRDRKGQKRLFSI